MVTPAFPASSRQTHSSARILVVDDDQAVRRLARRILEGGGYAVVTATDGVAALSAARAAMVRPVGTIHLVLTDIDMPGADGYGLGRLLAVTWPALPVIYMSGTTHGLARRAQLASSAHFIEKPFSAEHLRHIIGLVLRGRVFPPPAAMDAQGQEAP
jgi:CheY-like chemotaxis protein